MLLVPADALRPRKIDERYARAIGRPVVAIDHDAIVACDVERAVARVTAHATAAYGRMLGPHRYANSPTLSRPRRHLAH